MDKIIAVKNFVVFAVPLSVLLVCKIVLPVSMYNSIVDYTADNFFMPPQDNRGLCTMYKTSLTPKTFLLWTTSNVEAIKSSFSSLLLELGCKAHVGNTIDEEIEFIEYHSLQPVKLSQFNIPIEEQTPMMAIDQSKPIVVNIGSTS